MTTGLRLGRPGIHHAGRTTPPGFDPLRLDVAGFVGVALRGPVDDPVAVTSWSEYVRAFGGFETTVSGRDRCLPYAVRAFFAQGGQRCWVVRVAPPLSSSGPSTEEATALFGFDPDADERTPGRWMLAAADEGVWGDHLAIELSYVVERVLAVTVSAPDRLLLPSGAKIDPDSMCRIRWDEQPLGVLRRCSPVDDPAALGRLVGLDVPVDQPSESALRMEVITGTLIVSDPAPGGPRDERLTGLGICPGHPRFLPDALCLESRLLRAAGAWHEPLPPDLLLTSRRAQRLRRGEDRTDTIDRGSFFDPGEPHDDPLEEPCEDHRGVDAIGRVPELGLLCVPDLTWGPARVLQSRRPTPPSPTDPAPCGGWSPCPPLADPHTGTMLDGRLETLAGPAQLGGTDAADLAEIEARQDRLVAVAVLRARFVVLLDVPDGLSVAGIAQWRARFDSSYAAAYHPWLGVPRAVDSRPGTAVERQGATVLVPPSAFAAGIVADHEHRFGLSRGPANELARDAVRSAGTLTESAADELHLLSINVFYPDRDGFRLVAARTLSADPDYRQLSVRRLMTMLAVTLERQSQWLVFEPNTEDLRARLVSTITQLLRVLHRRGAFAGADEEDSFFVRCGPELNSAADQERGRLVAEVGVAPATPLEYLVLRLSLEVEGRVTVVPGPGGGRRA